MSSRIRVSDDVVAKALIQAKGEKTMQELAAELQMKESTLRAQIARIEKKVTAVAVQTNHLNFKFPAIKDGRSVNNGKSNAESLLTLFA